MARESNLACRLMTVPGVGPIRGHDFDRLTNPNDMADQRKSNVLV